MDVPRPGSHCHSCPRCPALSSHEHLAGPSSPVLAFFVNLSSSSCGFLASASFSLGSCFSRRWRPSSVCPKRSPCDFYTPPACRAYTCGPLGSTHDCASHRGRRDVAHSFQAAWGRSDLHLRGELLRDDVLGCPRINRDGQLIRVAHLEHCVDLHIVQVAGTCLLVHLPVLGLLLVLRLNRDEVSHCQSRRSASANRHLLILIGFLQCSVTQRLPRCSKEHRQR